MSTALCKLAALEDLAVWWDISDGVMRAGRSAAERDRLGGLSGISAIPPIPMLLTKTEFWKMGGSENDTVLVFCQAKVETAFSFPL